MYRYLVYGYRSTAYVFKLCFSFVWLWYWFYIHSFGNNIRVNCNCEVVGREQSLATGRSQRLTQNWNLLLENNTQLLNTTRSTLCDWIVKETAMWFEVQWREAVGQLVRRKYNDGSVIWRILPHLNYIYYLDMLFGFPLYWQFPPQQVLWGLRSTLSTSPAGTTQADRILWLNLLISFPLCTSY